MELPYKPAAGNAVACSLEVTAVLDDKRNTVHLHSFPDGGQRLQTVDFGLGEKDEIYDIGIKERVVHVDVKIDGRQKILSYVLH